MRAGRAAWAALIGVVLVAAVLLGFAAARGAVEPGLHGMAGVVAAALAIGSHVRRGRGLDFLAVVLLLVTVVVGTAIGDGVVHPALALAATALSIGLHLVRGVEPGRARAPEAPG